MPRKSDHAEIVDETEGQVPEDASSDAALHDVMNSTTPLPQTQEELRELMQQVVRDTLSNMAKANMQAQDIAENEAVAFDGNRKVVGLDAVRKLTHELITGYVPDPKERDPARAVKVKMHPGLFNMPWVMVTLPWTSEDERNFRQKLPTPYPKERYPQINGLAWRIVAGRPQRIPLIYAEVLAAAGIVDPAFLPVGNGVRRYLEEEERRRMEEEMRKRKIWASFGAQLPGDLTSAYQRELAELTPVPVR